MFTGLVETWVLVRAFELRGAGARLRLPAPRPGSGLPPVAASAAAPEPFARLGDSVAVSGTCLTVAAFARPGAPDEVPARPDGSPAVPDADLVFDLSAETLERTTLGALEPGAAVNLERSLRLGDRLGGHLVTGHVDGRGTFVGAEPEGDGGARLTFEVDAPFERWLVEKGSVAVDGVSLTVVRPRARRFDVAAIPLTLERTSLGRLAPGARVNLESDPLAKWVEHLLAPYRPDGSGETDRPSGAP